MKFVHEYRSPELLSSLTENINRMGKKSIRIMEICGGQTHSIMRFGLDQLLSGTIEWIHGPGCPVCVTPIEKIDQAIKLSENPNIILCTYADMLRVPGSFSSLEISKAQGNGIQTIYSPLECLEIAKKNPKKEIILFAIGFETTAPTHAATILAAKMQNIQNFSCLISHVLVPPALELILSSKDHQIDACLAAGHVCTITGYEKYHEIAQRFKIPIVVTGFEPVDLLEGVQKCLLQLENQTYFLENQYTRNAREAGNQQAIQTIQKVFEVSGFPWRGIGSIPNSGFKIKSEYRRFDAETKFAKQPSKNCIPTKCRAAEVLTGKLKPDQCPYFSKECNPDNPLGAPMVSTEGACAAYFGARLL